MSEMASRISQTRALLPTLEASLKTFQTSSSPFKIIRSINPSSTSTTSGSHTANPPVTSSPPVLGTTPRTLFILDSSYNPPSRAHLALATTALKTSKEPTPRRLLLLFSTSNADKAPAPASFVDRLAMMILFAEDLVNSLRDSQSPSSNAAKEGNKEGEEEKEEGEGEGEAGDLSIDIGLTTAPYYTDKSLAITSAKPSPYPSSPTHIHLLGYDTLTRFLAPKYYPHSTPPLHALSPFFDPGHKLLVLLRPENSPTPSGATEVDQQAFIKSLHSGHLENDGFERKWARQIDILQGGDVARAAGISSTLVRNAAKGGEWDRVRELCTEGVAAWVEEQDLYKEEE